MCAELDHLIGQLPDYAPHVGAVLAIASGIVVFQRQRVALKRDRLALRREQAAYRRERRQQ